MNEARQQLLAAFKATTHECQWPGCRTLVLNQRFCKRHEPLAGWAIAEQVRAENEASDDGGE